jgi:DNA recombination-dependent growth factor C
MTASPFFRNATLYRLPRPWSISVNALEERLRTLAFAPTLKMQAQSAGWASPRDDEQLVYAQGEHALITLRTETKVIPARSVELLVRERAAALEKEQGYKAGRRQRREIKERVLDEMLPKAFRQQRDTNVWLDRARGYLVVDSGTPSQCDAVMGALAKVLTPFPVSPLYVHVSPAHAMTRWLADDVAPDGFTVDTDAELRAAGDKSSVIRYQRLAIDAADIGRHIREGKQCTLLALTWSDRVSFTLTENLVLKRVRALDVLTQVAERKARTDDDQFATDFALMTGELSRLIAHLIHALGGEKLDLAQAADEQP